MKKENDILKTDITQLRTNSDAMKDEIVHLKADNIQLRTDNDAVKVEVGQLSTLLDKMAVNNENQIQQINSQSSEIVRLQSEVQQLKVSH